MPENDLTYTELYLAAATKWKAPEGIEGGWFPPDPEKPEHTEILRHNAEESVRALKRLGYRKSAGVMAGLASGSVWHGELLPELPVAEINVASWNRITFAGELEPALVRKALAAVAAVA